MITQTLKYHCISPSCGGLANEGSDKCNSCLGLIPKTKRGFTVWNDRAFCRECNQTIQVKVSSEQFICEGGWQGLKVYCPIHNIQI